MMRAGEAQCYRRVAGYVTAVIVIVLAAAVRYFLDSLLGDTAHYSTFYAAVAFAAAIGGAGPALLATALGAIIGAVFFVSPHGNGPLGHPDDITRLVLYLVVGVWTSWLGGRLFSTRQQAEAARAEAERANRMKDEFLAVISHELRTPLNSILMLTQYLRSGEAPEEELAASIENIERSALTQAHLVSDLLDISRISVGKLHLNCKEVELAKIAESALADIAGEAEAKQITLSADIHDRCVVNGDPIRLQQVVTNLLCNAVKFTPVGGCAALKIKAAGSRAELSVSDNGDGIAPEFLPFVFDPFRQADASIARHYGGLGLGLSLVKQLVELHGGSVQAASAGKGLGARLTVRLPLVRCEAATEAPAAPAEDTAAFWPGDPGQLRGKKIMVVDDDHEVCRFVGWLFAAAGAEVVSAHGGREAMQRLSDSRPDLLISDIAMPAGDGYELISHVRGRDDDLACLPAIALTALAGPEDRERALRTGYWAHLSKPVEARELFRLANELLTVYE